MCRHVITLFAVLLLTACLTGQSQHAESEPVSDRLISALSYCDDRFFQEMGRNKEHLQSLGEFGINGDIGFFVVKDRDQEPRYLMFSNELAGKTKIIGYLDSFTSHNSLGQYYYWGFLVSGTVEETRKAILPLLHNAKWLRGERGGYVISELYDLKQPGYGWMLFNNLKSGTIPSKDTLERVFRIEKAGKDYPPGMTLVNCSLQGRQIPDDILHSLRPDIKMEKVK